MRRRPRVKPVRLCPIWAIIIVSQIAWYARAPWPVAYVLTFAALAACTVGIVRAIKRLAHA